MILNWYLFIEAGLEGPRVGHFCPQTGKATFQPKEMECHELRGMIIQSSISKAQKTNTLQAAFRLRKAFELVPTRSNLTPLPQ